LRNADTPVVINFYHKLLPHFDKLLIWIGSNLAHLGENGRSFLPFLHKKLEEEKNRDISRWPEFMQSRHPGKIEKLHYIIDAIENGTGRSERYTFT